MSSVRSISLTVLRITGTVQVVTGLLFWAGFAYALIPVHMLSGLILALALLALAIAAITSRVARGLATLAVAWSIFLPIFGVMQSQILPGFNHWVVQVAHLLVGLAALGMGGRLAHESRSRQQSLSAS